jgi:PilZ domain
VRTFAIPTGRRYDRTPVVTPVTLIVRFSGNECQHRCLVVDSSEIGLRLQLDAPLTPNQIVLVVAGDDSKYAVRGRVVWVHKLNSGQNWEAGLVTDGITG